MMQLPHVRSAAKFSVTKHVNHHFPLLLYVFALQDETPIKAETVVHDKPVLETLYAHAYNPF